MTELEQVREFFQKDIFATEMAGIEIVDAKERYSKCRMVIRPCHKNAVGGIMGGAIFTLADFSFAVAANYKNPDTVTLTSQITYLGVCKGNELIAQCHCIKDGRRTAYYTVDIADELDNPVACVTMNGYHTGA